MAPRMERPDFGRPPLRSESVGRPRDPGLAVPGSCAGPPDVRTDSTGVIAADRARPRRASAPGVRGCRRSRARSIPVASRRSGRSRNSCARRWRPSIPSWRTAILRLPARRSADGRGRRLGADRPRRSARDSGAGDRRGTARAARLLPVLETVRVAEQQSGRARSVDGVSRPDLRLLSREGGLRARAASAACSSDNSGPVRTLIVDVFVGPRSAPDDRRRSCPRRRSRSALALNNEWHITETPHIRFTTSVEARGSDSGFWAAGAVSHMQFDWYRAYDVGSFRMPAGHGRRQAFRSSRDAVLRPGQRDLA